VKVEGVPGGRPNFFFPIFVAVTSLPGVCNRWLWLCWFFGPVSMLAECVSGRGSRHVCVEC
jgi:hypothetical protein